MFRPELPGGIKVAVMLVMQLSLDKATRLIPIVRRYLEFVFTTLKLCWATSDGAKRSTHAAPARSCVRNICSILLFIAPVLNAQEFQRFESKHLLLITDLPVQAELQQLPAQFDEGIKQAAAYFGIPDERLQGWKLTGYLMKSAERFRAAGYLHDQLPPFENGYQLGEEFWFYEQPSAYYRRHLMLHEGVHALMYRFLGGAGPPWYREGMAELLATHSYSEGRLQLNQLPADKQDYPDWGRITRIKQSVADGKTRSLREIMAIPYRRFNTVEAYSWGWAMCLFLERHPVFQESFRRCHKRLKLTNQEFNARLIAELNQASAADAANVVGEEVNAAWALFAHEVEYGYNVAENCLSRIEPPAQLGKPFKLRVDCGWQATGLTVKSGQRYQLKAAGRFQLNGDRRWVSEANGVTSEYRQGNPRGRLLLAIHDPSQGALDEAASTATLVHPLPVGRAARWTAHNDGQIYLRINELAGERSDNRGALRVLITTADAPSSQ